VYRCLRRAGRNAVALARSSALDLLARIAALTGHSGRAVTLQAARIRRFERDRECPAAYHRLDRLLARHGAGDSELDVASARPERFVCFVGYSRSGHSLVGSLIDAHPDAEIAHELHALKHLAAGVDFDAVLRAARQNARIFHITGRTYTGYDYVVPGQYQGSCRRPVVAGDKKGNGTARLLRRDPDLLARLESRLPVPLHFIHVVRNPYDCIASKALRTGDALENAAARYLANARLIAELRARRPARIHDVHLDQLLAAPQRELSALLMALGLDPEVPDYLDACAGILFACPRRTRDRVAWPARLVDRIEAGLAEISTLGTKSEAPTAGGIRRTA